MRKLFYLATALTFAACNNEEYPGDINRDAEIHLTSSVVASRGTTQSTQIIEGENIYTWMFTTGETPVEAVKAWKLTADGTGKLTGETPRYFPDGANNLKAYSVHSKADIAENTEMPQTIAHEVSANQKTTEEYIKSDLLFSIKDNVEKGKQNAVNFYHMLSKIEIKLIPGDGISEDNLNTVTVSILNTKPSATLSLDKTKGEQDLTQENRNALVSATGEVRNISVQPVINDYAEAVIVPQTLVMSTKFIEINLEGTPMYFELASEKTFESGKRYRYDITVKRAGLTIVERTTDWTDNSEETVAEIDIPAIGKTLLEKDLLSGALRNASGEFKAYYMFDKNFTTITSYIIQQTDDKKDIVVKTQNVTVSEDENTVSWAEAIADGCTSMTLSNGDITLSGDLKSDSNVGASDKFLTKQGGNHHVIEINDDYSSCKTGDMSRLFLEYAKSHAKMKKIEVNCDWNFDFVIVPDYYTFYKTSYEKLSKDEVVMKNDNLECETGYGFTTDANKDLTPKIEGMLRSFYDNNIVVPAGAGQDFFYMINKSGKGWFKLYRKLN